MPLCIRKGTLLEWMKHRTPSIHQLKPVSSQEDPYNINSQEKLEFSSSTTYWTMNESLISTYDIRYIWTNFWHQLAPIDPFTLSHPTAVQTSLFAGALFAKFDPTGRFIAAARLNGSAEIWDLETRAPIRWLDGHVKTITSIECVFLTSYKATTLLTVRKAGREILDIFWHRRKTGTSLSGTFPLPVILHNDKNPFDLMSQSSVPRFIPKISEIIFWNVHPISNTMQ